MLLKNLCDIVSRVPVEHAVELYMFLNQCFKRPIPVLFTIFVNAVIREYFFQEKMYPNYLTMVLKVIVPSTLPLHKNTSFLTIKGPLQDWYIPMYLPSYTYLQPSESHLLYESSHAKT